MIETYKVVHGIYDMTVSPCLPHCLFSATRGNNFKLVEHYRRYDIQKYSFTQRVINLWNILPSYVVNSVSVNNFKTSIDKFWCSQDVYYNYKCDDSDYLHCGVWLSSVALFTLHTKHVATATKYSCARTLFSLTAKNTPRPCYNKWARGKKRISGCADLQMLQWVTL